MMTILGLSTLVLANCTLPPGPNSATVTPTFPPKLGEQPLSQSTMLGPSVTAQAAEIGPAPPVAAPTRRITASPSLPVLAETPAESLSLEQVTLPVLVDEVYAKALKLTVQIDPAIAGRTDVVTLRTGRALAAEDLFEMARKILAGYGLALYWDGTVLHVLQDSALMAQMPDLIRSRALPDLPSGLRPVFQIIDLHQVSAADMLNSLNSAFGSKVKLFASPKANSIMLFGLPENVRAAVQAVQVLDQARLAGRQSLRLSPVYWTAQKMAAKLVEVLRAEGYDADISSSAQPGQITAISIVPVDTNNSVIVFAADPALIAHIRQWGKDLDQPSLADPSRSIFVYAVNNTTATSLGRTVQRVLGSNAQTGEAPEARLERAGGTQTQAATAGVGTTAMAAAQPTRTQSQPGTDDTQDGSASGNAANGPRVVVDSLRNALVFVGTAQDYERIRPVLESLDKPAREALIEVTVAEITLDDSTSLGVEWSLFNGLPGGLRQRMGTGTNTFLNSSSSSSSVGIPLGTSGFNYTIINNLNDVRFVLNAFAENNHVRVISTPRVLAKSGSEATLNVGTQVPIITSQGTTSQVSVSGNSGILQSIEYQKTGVLLTVTPIVHSGNRIDLAINQVVSQPIANTVSDISSPEIQERTVSTQLTLSDGTTVVIGGLITENITSDDSGVPFLKDVPGLGLLFKSQSLQKTRQELLVFITPYVISNDADAASITGEFQQQMNAWPTPSSELQW
jgi:general secretion pathway protein D